MTKERRLTVLTIYERPSDYPEHYVVRAWLAGASDGRPIVAPADRPLAVVDTLEQARDKVPHGLRNVGRQPADDPVIVESWL